MPHLAPISWILTLLTFWTFLILFINAYHWSQLPQLKTAYSHNKHSFPSWNWAM